MEHLTTVLANPIALLFTILVLGTLLGKVKLHKIELSSAGGVLFVALIFGHYGFSLPDELGSLGFALFIYSIGFGAGPRFFQTFRRNGLKYVAVALVVVIVATATAVTGARVFNFSLKLLPGILAGALTSTSTLASAYQVTNDPVISVGYGITYPFGLIGLLMMIQYLPKIMKIDLKQEALEQRTIVTEDESETIENSSQRIYSVENPELIGRRLKDLDIPRSKQVLVRSIRHDDETDLAGADTILSRHDHILVEGAIEHLVGMESFIGPEVVDRSLLASQYQTVRVVINKKQVVGKSLRDLGLIKKYMVLLTRIQRTGVDLNVNPDIKLERSDIVTLVGKPNSLPLAVETLGRKEHRIFETDMFTFCVGLFAGLILGMIKLPGINTEIGSAGGLLFAGIILGYLRNFGPFSGRVPLAARFILQELGMLLFVAAIGTKAGVGLVDHLLLSGLEIFVTGACVTTFTLLATVLFSRYILHFDWNTSFGATTGGVTSTVALQVITAEAESNYAVLGYAGVYAFANIVLTILGQLVLLFS